MHMASKVPHYKLDILSPKQNKQNDISAILQQLLKLIADAHVLLIPWFTLAWRHYPMQLVSRDLNSDPFASFKNHFSMSRTDSHNFYNHGIFFI